MFAKYKVCFTILNRKSITLILQINVKMHYINAFSEMILAPNFFVIIEYSRQKRFTVTIEQLVDIINSAI